MQRDFIEPGGFGESLGNDVSLLRGHRAGRAARARTPGARRGGLVVHTREAHRADLSDCPPAKRNRGNPTLRIGDAGPDGPHPGRAASPATRSSPRWRRSPARSSSTSPARAPSMPPACTSSCRQRGITHLLFAGVTTEVCVQTIMREANDRGYDCLLLEDCTESYFPAVQGGDARDDPRAGRASSAGRRPSAQLLAALAALPHGATLLEFPRATATARSPPRRRSPPCIRSRADEVYEQLKRDVAEFNLVPGDRFTENEISERLGVSRTPVRQALFRLQQEGYVEVLFRSGWRVLPFDFDQFEQLYDLRMVLETTAVHRLCADGERVDRALLRRSWPPSGWCPRPSAAADTAQVAQWDEAFHCSLVAAAGNAEMARVHRDVTDRIRIIRRLDFTKQPRIDATYDEHAKILKADPAQARRPGRDAAARAHRDQPGGGAQDHAAPGASGAARGWVRHSFSAICC